MSDQSPWTRLAERRPCMLQALISEFGGEATCVSMSIRLGRFIEASGVRQGETRNWIQKQFCALEDRGDVTVEMTDQSVFIARVTEAGACRAYG